MAELATSEDGTGWRDLITGDRLARFALVCVGTWLNAADELMTATIMPSVAHDIGGYAYFGWAVATFLLGSILGGATAGRLSASQGLRRAIAVGAAIYALGCVASALSPSIGWFLVGRFLQGLGGGWVMGLCYVAVSALFPQSLWTRVFGALAGVWGAATLFSPLIGGIFAEAGFWQGAFWLFAAQGLIFIAAAWFLIRDNPQTEAPPSGRPPYLQVVVLAVAVAAIGCSGLIPDTGVAAACAAFGLVAFGLFLWLDRKAASPLLPREASDPTSAVGAGLLMVFALAAATTSFSVYGSALLQALYHARPILAGYILGAMAFAWTTSALLVAGRSEDKLFIRIGVVSVLAGLIGLALSVPHRGLILIAASVVAQGAGFGLAWSFTTARIIAGAPEDERAFASSSMPTGQLIGAAVGAAAAGAIANLLGVGRGITEGSAEAAGFWLFAAFIPLAVVGCLAAWRLTSDAVVAAPLASDGR